MCFEVAEVYYRDNDNNLRIAYIDMFINDSGHCSFSFTSFVKEIESIMKFPNMICNTAWYASLYDPKKHWYYQVYWIDDEGGKIILNSKNYGFFLRSRKDRMKVYVEKFNLPSSTAQSEQQQSPTPTEASDITDEEVEEKCNSPSSSAQSEEQQSPTPAEASDITDELVEEKCNSPSCSTRSQREQSPTPTEAADITNEAAVQDRCDNSQCCDCDLCEKSNPEKEHLSSSSMPDQTPKGNQTDDNTGDNNNKDEVVRVDPMYGRACVEVLKSVSEIFGKLLDPLGITVSLDVGLKGDNVTDEQLQSKSKRTPEASQEAAAQQNDLRILTSARKPDSSDVGTQSPNLLDVDCPGSMTRSVASVESNQSVSASIAEPASLTNEAEVVENDVSLQIGANKEKATEVNTEVAARNTSTKMRESSPNEGGKIIANQLADLSVDGQPEVDNQSSSTNTQQRKLESKSPHYSQHFKDVLNHITVASVVYHSDMKINNAVIAMISMGFSNTGGWLTNLLEIVDGNISKALALIHP